MKFLFSLTLITLALLPDTTSAQGIFAGICEGATCSACHLAVLGNTLIDWLIGVIMVLFAVLAVVAGFGLVTARGNPTAVTDAKSKFTNAIIGLLIVLSAWLIVDTLMKALIGNNGVIEGYGPWAEIKCATQSESEVKPGNLGTFDQVKFTVTPGTLESQQTEREFLAGNSCTSPTLSVEELRDLGCGLNPCDRSCLFSCMDVRVSTNGVAFCVSRPSVTGGATGPLSGSVAQVPESQMLSLQSAGVNVANWQGINGPGRTDLAHPDVVAAVVWMQQEGQRRFGGVPFQVTSAYTRGVGHSANSQHYTGRAVDMQPVSGSSVTLQQLNQLARDAGFTFVLTESRHVHMDAR